MLAAILFLNTFVNAYSAQHAILLDADTGRCLAVEQVQIID